MLVDLSPSNHTSALVMYEIFTVCTHVITNDGGATPGSAGHTIPCHRIDPETYHLAMPKPFVEDVPTEDCGCRETPWKRSALLLASATEIQPYMIYFWNAS
jgi:hypothetical protein